VKILRGPLYSDEFFHQRRKSLIMNKLYLSANKFVATLLPYLDASSAAVSGTSCGGGSDVSGI
jgi:hypothetical protein